MDELIDFTQDMNHIEEEIEIEIKRLFEKEVIKREGNKFILDYDLLILESPFVEEEFSKHPLETISLIKREIKERFGNNFILEYKNISYSEEISNIRVEHLGKTVKVKGIISNITGLHTLTVKSYWRCTNCNTTRTVEGAERPKGCSCKESKGFKLLGKDLVDVQELFVEEDYNDIGNKNPKKVRVRLLDELCTKEMNHVIIPGTKVEIIGVAESIPMPPKNNKTKEEFGEFRIHALQVNSLEGEFDETITDEDIQEIEEIALHNPLETLAKSIAPGIKERDMEKKAVLLAMARGKPTKEADGSEDKDTIHIMFIGDPGQAKTKILQSCARLHFKGHYSDCTGLSEPALIAAAGQDKLTGSWSLSPGLLVRRNKGLQCLHPDTRVMINGQTKKICEVSKKEIERLENNYTYSLNDNKLSKEKVSLFSSKNPTNKMLKITLDSGLEIKCTEDHRLLEGDTFKWKQAKELVEGNFLLSNDKPIIEDFKLNIYDILDDKTTLILDEKSRKLIKSKIIEIYGFNKNKGGMLKLFNLPEGFFNMGRKITKRKLNELLLKLGIGLEEVNFSYFSTNAKQIIPKEITPNLAYIIGFIIGDGNISKNKKDVRIGQSKIHGDYINHLLKIGKEVYGNKINYSIGTKKGKSSKSNKISNKNRTITASEDSLSLNFSSKILNSVCKWFESNLDKLPTEIFKHCLAGMIDADGCLSEKNYKKDGKDYKIQHFQLFISNNKKMNQDIVYSLKKVGIFSKINQSVGVKEIIISDRKNVNKLVNFLDYSSLKINKKIKLKKKSRISGKNELLPIDKVKEIANQIYLNIPTTTLLKRGVHSTLYGYLNGKNAYKESFKYLYNKIKDIINVELDIKFKYLLEFEFYKEKIKKVEEIEYSGKVYDLSVPSTENFLANGFVTHNCLDEFDKAKDEAKTALHTVMETKIVTVNKASINATLNADCTILIGANPKNSRFDPNKSVVEQINLAPTLISRMDLILVFRDLIEEEQDDLIANSVLGLNDKIEYNIINQDLFRKYLKYIQKIEPIMDKEAALFLKEKYKEIRQMSKKSEELSGMPIVARHLKAMRRLAEANAKLRLSEKVEIEDVKIAHSLFEESLIKLGLDTENGVIDFARIGNGVTLKTKDKISSLLDLIKQKHNEKGFTTQEEIEDFAFRMDIDSRELDKLIFGLKSEGKVFSPRNGQYCYLE